MEKTVVAMMRQLIMIVQDIFLKIVPSTGTDKLNIE